MFQHGANEESFLTANKSSDCRFALPGYGRPLDFAPVEKNIYGVASRSMFPSALDDRDIENGYTEYVDDANSEDEWKLNIEDFPSRPSGKLPWCR